VAEPWERPRIWAVLTPGPAEAPPGPAPRSTDQPLAQRPALARRLDGDRVLIDVTGKAVYVLNSTAWVSWELCDGRHSAERISSELARRYQVDQATVAPGCFEVLAFLQAAELLVEVDG
jgi:Coenzyme PQQ synthesis protein D (PqqD)